MAFASRRGATAGIAERIAGPSASRSWCDGIAAVLTSAPSGAAAGVDPSADSSAD